MFQRLLVCTDFTDGLNRLTHFVPSLAKAGIQHITFFHSVPLWESGEIPRVDTEKIEAARQQLTVALSDRPADIDVQVEVSSGRPLDLILQTAVRHQSDLILVGISSRNLLTNTLFGNTTVELHGRTTIPLMILRPQLISAFTAEELDLRCQHLFRNWLLPYDGTEPSKFMVNRIKQLAQNRPPGVLEKCSVCWVVEDVSREAVLQDAQRQTAEKALVAVKAELEACGIQTETAVRQGNPVVEVLEAASMDDVSAIALSSRLPNKLVDWSTPHFAVELLRRSWHPLIYFPGQR